ncbi:MAG TPA: hypothetical protein VEC57_00390 [Candidatus Limnocylindrales bacterium]|nr:hypothetical protein [Candidatus Limnocylindrales bacterium]
MISRTHSRVASFLLVAVLPAAVAACDIPGPRPQVLHESFGHAQVWNRQAHALDPDASADMTPVRTMHGGAAAAAHAEYVKSFTPKPGAGAARSYSGLSGIAGD